MVSRHLSKEELRSFIRIERGSKDASWAFLQSKRITETVLEQSAVQGARRLGCYLAKEQEVQTADLIKACWAQGCELCVPAFREDKGQYAWANYREDTTLTTGNWNISEPSTPEWIAQTLDVVLVPGLAFDEQGNRLGYGGGHFDRLLAGTEAFCIGLAFDYQIQKSLEPEAHDVRMNLIVSQTRAIPIS